MYCKLRLRLNTYAPIFLVLQQEYISSFRSNLEYILRNLSPHPRLPKMENASLYESYEVTVVPCFYEL